MRFFSVLIILCGSIFAAALDREAFTIIKYDLDVRLEPEQQRLGARGKIRLRNDSQQPQKTVALQLSSSLSWRAIRVGDKPAAGVRMRLQPLGAPTDTPNPHATTGADGGFALETSGQPGAPEGRYALILHWPPPTGFGPPGGLAADRFAGRYASVDRPFGEVTIRPGTNDLGTLDVPEVAQSFAPQSNKRRPRP